ncbi:MAG: ABC transporter permease, partial [Chloroflexota bacterium]
IAQSFGYYNFAGESGFTLEHWAQLQDNRNFWRSFFYSLRIATISSLASVFLAYPLALWLRKPFPGSDVIGAVLKIPYLVPGLVAAFLYVNFISFNGFLNQMLLWAGFIEEPLRMQNDRYGIGVIILQIWKQLPFALLLLLGAVGNISDDIYAAARDVGAGLMTRFTRITLPLTLQTLQVALIIIFIGAAGDFSFQTIAGPRRVFSMAQFMYSTQTINRDWNYSAVIAVMLMLLSLVGSVGLAGIMQLLIRGRVTR